MISERAAARTDVPAKFSQIPVNPIGHRTPIRRRGKTKAVDTEIREAGKGFSIASM